MTTSTKKIEFVTSTLNGMTRNEPFHNALSKEEISKINDEGHFYRNKNIIIVFKRFGKEILVEIKSILGDSMASNNYRDLYRLV